MAWRDITRSWGILSTAAAIAGAILTAADAAAQPGTIIVLNKADSTATLIDRDTRRAVATLPTGAGPHEAAVSPDGRTAVVADYGAQAAGSTLTVIDLPNKRVARTLRLEGFHRPHGLAFLPDGRLAVTAETEKALILVDVASGEVVRAFETAQDATHMVALSPDGTKAYTANIMSGSMTAIDLAAAEGAEGAIRTVETGAGAEGIDVSPDARELWVTNRAADTVSVVDAASLEVVATIPCGRFPIRARFTPDGSRVLVSCAMSGEVAVFDAATRREIARIPMVQAEAGDRSGRVFQTGGPVPIGILIPPEGTQAFIACAGADQIVVIDLSRLGVDGVIDTGKEPDGMAFSPVELAPAVVPSRPLD